MALIVAVHGIGQQFSGDAILQEKWWSALLSGVHLVGHNLTDKSQLVCPFYGHLFRPPGALALCPVYCADDIQPEDEEAELLALFWRAAAKAEPNKVPSPESYAAGTSLVGTPQIVQCALKALLGSSFFENISESVLIGDLKQVVRYLNQPGLRESVLTIVQSQIISDTRVVIGHSLGSVVAYEALCRNPKNVVSFVSIGSPLGIRNLIFDKLTPHPNTSGIGAWPGPVKYWTNIADKGDIVALEKKLAPFFSKRVKDILVCNGSDAHDATRYLTTKEAGEAIAAGIWDANS